VVEYTDVDFEIYGMIFEF